MTLIPRALKQLHNLTSVVPSLSVPNPDSHRLPPLSDDALGSCDLQFARPQTRDSRPPQRGAVTVAGGCFS